MICDIFNKLCEHRVVSILRGVPSETLEPVLDALCKGGVYAVEITMNTDHGLDRIERAKKHVGGRMMIGAGTVLDAQTARLCILAGADFLLSPVLAPDMIALCNQYDKLAVPGIFTPTEALQARRLGALMIKVFPVGSVGPQYIRDLLGPLGQLSLMPVGGVTLENAADFFKAGAAAIGVGSCLVSGALAAKHDFDEITRRAKAFQEAAGPRA